MVRPSFSEVLKDLRNLFPAKRIERLQIARHLLKIKTPWYPFALRPGLGEFTYHPPWDLLPFGNIPGS